MRTGLWPFRSAPFADELLTSWIARLAHGHGLRPTSFLSIIHPGRSDFAALDWASDKGASRVAGRPHGHSVIRDRVLDDPL
jgi:hypothetical protein